MILYWFWQRQQFHFICSQNLAENDLQTYGAQLLCEMLNDNDAILSLNISGSNYIKMHSRIEYVHEFLKTHWYWIKDLNIPNNEISFIFTTRLW